MTDPHLSAERVRSLLRYDRETGNLYWRVARGTGGRFPAGTEAGSRCRMGHTYYLVIWIDGHSYLAHRLIWLMVTGGWPREHIDHEDHDGLNNRWSNLSAVPHKKNLRNQRLRATNTSGINGVSQDRRSGRWRAYIKVDGRKRSLGAYDTVEQAAAARRQADLKYGFHENHGRAFE